MTHIIRNICHLKWIYLARAVELSGFELRQTISFALLIVITIVHSSSKRQAVIVNTCIPVLVFFNKLKTEFSSGDKIWTHLAITNRIFAIVTTIQAIGFAWTIWNDFFKVFDGNFLTVQAFRIFSRALTHTKGIIITSQNAFNRNDFASIFTSHIQIWYP